MSAENYAAANDTQGDLEGAIVADRYRLESLRGRGGQASVYAGTDEILGVPRALKIFHEPALIRDATFMGEGEAAALARLREVTAHVLRLYEFSAMMVTHGDEATRYPVMVSELADRSVQDMLNQEERVKPDGSKTLVGPGQTVHVLKQAAEGLDAAHQNGIVHRDVKPGNLLYVEKRVVVADFGISGKDRSAPGASQTKKIWASLGYASPEQIAGFAGPQSDVYSLGATGCRMLSGELPLSAGGPGVESLPLFPETDAVYSNLRRVIGAALAADLRERLQNMAQFKGALLRAYQDGLDKMPTVIDLTRPDGFAPTLPMPTRREPDARSAEEEIKLKLAKLAEQVRSGRTEPVQPAEDVLVHPRVAADQPKARPYQGLDWYRSGSLPGDTDEDSGEPEAAPHLYDQSPESKWDSVGTKSKLIALGLAILTPLVAAGALEVVHDWDSIKKHVGIESTPIDNSPSLEAALPSLKKTFEHADAKRYRSEVMAQVHLQTTTLASELLQDGDYRGYAHVGMAAQGTHSYDGPVSFVDQLYLAYGQAKTSEQRKDLLDSAAALMLAQGRVDLDSGSLIGGSEAHSYNNTTEVTPFAPEVLDALKFSIKTPIAKEAHNDNTLLTIAENLEKNGHYLILEGLAPRLARVAPDTLDGIVERFDLQNASAGDIQSIVNIAARIPTERQPYMMRFADKLVVNHPLEAAMLGLRVVSTTPEVAWAIQRNLSGENQTYANWLTIGLSREYPGFPQNVLAKSGVNGIDYRWTKLATQRQLSASEVNSLVAATAAAGGGKHGADIDLVMRFAALAAAQHTKFAG